MLLVCYIVLQRAISETLYTYCFLDKRPTERPGVKLITHPRRQRYKELNPGYNLTLHTHNDTRHKTTKKTLIMDCFSETNLKTLQRAISSAISRYFFHDKYTHSVLAVSHTTTWINFVRPFVCGLPCVHPGYQLASHCPHMHAIMQRFTRSSRTRDHSARQPATATVHTSIY